jgi:DNA-binding MarR family transcriptional regulator
MGERVRADRDDAADLAALLDRCATATTAAVAGRLEAAGHGEPTRAQAALLDAVAATPSATAAGLAPPLGVSPQAVSKAAADLVARGYLATATDAGDRRARVLRTTARGDAFLAARRRARDAVAREQRRWLGERDAAELMRLLCALAELDAGPAV